MKYFEESDSKLKKIYEDYKSGSMLTSELKGILIDTLNKFLDECRKRKVDVSNFV